MGDAELDNLLESMLNKLQNGMTDATDKLFEMYVANCDIL